MSTTTRYETWRDVLDYCRRSANPVGRLVLRVAGYDDPTLDAQSDAVCTALQLTNFWQDLAIDWRRGRLYLPAEERTRAFAREADLNRAEMTPEWRDAVRQAIRRTRELFDRRTPICDAVRGRLRWELRFTWLGGMRILDNIEAVGCDVFNHRPTLGADGRAASSAGGRFGGGRPSRRADMARDTNFYYSFLVLPPDKRRAIVAVWDFCRAVDDAVDEAGRGRAGATRRCAMEDRARRVFDGRPPQTPQGRTLAPLVQPFNLPRSAFDALIEGVEMDLDSRRYETFADLYEYCIRVASAIGLICLEIFGYDDPRSRQYATDLGVALQLTNILRDVPEDLSRGRVYIPQEDLRAHGCTEDGSGSGSQRRRATVSARPT